MPSIQTHRVLNRTMQFALEIVQFTRRLGGTFEARHFAGQLLRSGTSVAANYRAARRARTRREFIAKLGVVIEECDESLFWLELLGRIGVGASEPREALRKEANELTALFVVTRIRARRPQARP